MVTVFGLGAFMARPKSVKTVVNLGNIVIAYCKYVLPVKAILTLLPNTNLPLGSSHL